MDPWIKVWFYRSLIDDFYGFIWVNYIREGTIFKINSLDCIYIGRTTCPILYWLIHWLWNWFILSMFVSLTPQPDQVRVHSRQVPDVSLCPQAALPWWRWGHYEGPQQGETAPRHHLGLFISVSSLSLSFNLSSSASLCSPLSVPLQEGP